MTPAGIVNSDNCGNGSSRYSGNGIVMARLTTLESPGTSWNSGTYVFWIRSWSTSESGAFAALTRSTGGRSAGASLSAREAHG